MFKAESRNGGIVGEHTGSFGRRPDMSEIDGRNFQALDDAHDIGVFEPGDDAFTFPMSQPVGGVVAEVQVLKEDRPRLMGADKFSDTKQHAPAVGAGGLDKQGNPRAVGGWKDRFQFSLMIRHRR